MFSWICLVWLSLERDRESDAWDCGGGHRMARGRGGDLIISRNRYLDPGYACKAQADRELTLANVPCACLRLVNRGVLLTSLWHPACGSSWQGGGEWNVYNLEAGLALASELCAVSQASTPVFRFHGVPGVSARAKHSGKLSQFMLHWSVKWHKFTFKFTFKKCMLLKPTMWWYTSIQYTAYRLFSIISIFNYFGIYCE